LGPEENADIKQQLKIKATQSALANSFISSENSLVIIIFNNFRSELIPVSQHSQCHNKVSSQFIFSLIGAVIAVTIA